MEALFHSGSKLVERVIAGTLRFRLLRGLPSHEKLYLLACPSAHRVLTGAANLGLAAFEGRQREVLVAFDGERAWRLSTGTTSATGRTLIASHPDGRLAPVMRRSHWMKCRSCGCRTPASLWSINRHARCRRASPRTHCARPR